MKEATGELNMTVITVIAIAAIAGIFYAFVWPAIRIGIEQNSKCANAFGCDKTCGEKNTRTCNYYGDDGNPASDTVECPCD